MWTNALVILNTNLEMLYKYSASELRDAMINLGEKMAQEEVEDMIKEADQNGDGRIDYDGKYSRVLSCAVI